MLIDYFPNSEIFSPTYSFDNTTQWEEPDISFIDNIENLIVCLKSCCITLNIIFIAKLKGFFFAFFALYDSNTLLVRYIFMRFRVHIHFISKQSFYFDSNLSYKSIILKSFGSFDGLNILKLFHFKCIPNINRFLTNVPIIVKNNFLDHVP